MVSILVSVQTKTNAMYYNSTRFASRCVPAFYAPFNFKKLRFFMKVNAILLLVILFTVGSLTASPGSAQTLSDVKVSIDINRGTLRSAFSQIEKQTDFRFAYRNELISSVKDVTLNGESRSVKSTLDELLKGTGLNYKQVNNSVIIFKDAPAKAQDITINGVVKDENNLPLPGVSVKVKGTNTGVTTDGEGKYIIRVANENVILVFSYIGYVTAEAPVKNGRMTNVSLRPDVGTLDDVVVIGYGTTTKRNNTGSVSSITAKSIANQPVADPLAALQGRVAGLDISAVTGYPGSGYNVRLRGQNSISSGNSPLYIVDGIPFISESLSQFTGANGTQSPLSSINPSDIERIDVLKDADATSIYGSRGANGVILITTKKGRSGKAEVNMNVYQGFAQVNHKVDMLNTAQYLELRREAFKNDAVTPTETLAPDLLTWSPDLDQNWQEKLFGKSAGLTEAQLSLSGGTEQTNFLVGGTFRNEKSVLPGNTGYTRGSLNSSLNYNSQDNKFRMTSSIKYVIDENNSAITDLAGSFNLAPNLPIYDANGNYYWYSPSEQNPMALLERTNVTNTNNMFVNTSLAYTIIKGLNAKLSAGYNRLETKQVQTLPKISFNPATYSGSTGNYGNGSFNSYILEPQLDYTIQLGKGNLSALAGGTFQHSITEAQSVIGGGYVSDEQLENIKAATVVTPRTYTYTKYRYASFFGRLTYNFDEKYIINGTFRRDGSSRFGPGKRFGNFGSVGAAWLISNESFVKDQLKFLSFAKLRTSYGTVGNDQIGSYQFLDSWSSTSLPYGGSAGIYPSRFPNPDYSWEVNKKLEFGIDLGFVQDRFMLTANFYRTRSGNQLIGYPLSSQSGFTEYTANLPAVVQNQGFEFEITSANVRGGNFTWNTSANLTIARNKLIDYPNLATTANSNRYVIGQPLTIVKGYDFTGINPATGVPLFRDVNGDGAFTETMDMVVMGNTMPKFYGGLSNSLTYKKISLDFFFQFAKQEGPGLNYGFQTFSNGALKNKDLSALDRWQSPGQVTSIPGASTTSGKAIYNAYQNLYRLSNANWVDASFIRLKNVSLKYNLTDVIKNSKFKNLSVYVQAQNLFTITSYDGFDPETKGYALPPLSVYTAGLQLAF
ncbi:TonB-dependent receptor [Pedobacter hiemivivus]|uniref:TonB-dependent receptor n=2 Tax=Pedobacter hiemivivus TaxID=2530454 RepID=A0A4U1G2Z9_9SPHI|nr:TonB-dependent receptor [Pedobacter hiemivivus]